VMQAGGCGAGSPALNAVVDDLLVFVRIAPIDQAFGTLAQAGVCVVRPTGGLPVVARLTVDAADITRLEGQGALVDLVLHELAHAYVATWLGDPSPRADGRLTLNPIPHLDPLGTAMFAITAFASSFIFGWAKPVMINPRHFRRPQVDMAIVAAAGPATNLVLALGCVAVLVHGDLTGTAFTVLVYAFQVNVVLGLFNLIPIPPLDGSRIIAAVMPRAMHARWAQLDQVGMIGIFVLIIVLFGTPVLGQRALRAQRRRAFAALERARGTRVIAMIHRQETVGVFGVPFYRFIDIDDSEAVLRAIRQTPADSAIDLLLHTPGGLVLASEQIAYAVRAHPGKVTSSSPTTRCQRAP